MIATGQSQQILGLENAFGTRDRVNFHMEREIQRQSMHGLFSPNDSADIRVSGGRLPQPGQTKGDPPRPPSTRASHSRASSVTTNCLLRQRLPSNALRNQRHSYGLSNVLEVPNWRKIAFA